MESSACLAPCSPLAHTFTFTFDLPSGPNRSHTYSLNAAVCCVLIMAFDLNDI